MCWLVSRMINGHVRLNKGIIDLNEEFSMLNMEGLNTGTGCLVLLV